jgi:hypothetical protein
MITANHIALLNRQQPTTVNLRFNQLWNRHEMPQASRIKSLTLVMIGGVLSSEPRQPNYVNEMDTGCRKLLTLAQCDRSAAMSAVEGRRLTA